MVARSVWLVVAIGKRTGGSSARELISRSALLRVCRNRGGRRDDCRLGGELVFVDQAAEQVTAADTIEVDHVSEGLLVEWRRLAERRPLSQ